MFRYLDFFSATRLIEVVLGYILHIKFCCTGGSAPVPFTCECSVTFERAGLASLIEGARGRCENILTNFLADSGSASALHAH
jgi:hypothetical protein